MVRRSTATDHHECHVQHHPGKGSRSVQRRARSSARCSLRSAPSWAASPARASAYLYSASSGAARHDQAVSAVPRSTPATLGAKWTLPWMTQMRCRGGCGAARPAGAAARLQSPHPQRRATIAEPERGHHSEPEADAPVSRGWLARVSLRQSAKEHSAQAASLHRCQGCVRMLRMNL